ncbi:hypothetical protein CG471_15925 [Sphingobium sp. IP1]|uniref:hypothetical protein n=1 Tax=Sphingobium sp. IP1 TaxID=2021637 RepID=UPI000C076B72|nr:hypothetical protein [Sphingobium sp. IP1]PHP18756.1 hypothetical protein CG471_15925 [Sphingobium sp. IP1]
MVKIAAHHIAGTPEHRFSSMLHSNPDYTPTCAWPDDCMVQWGHGLVPAVPFFEAFPVGTFIRGEGETIAAAEQQAFEKYQRDLACDHVWGRHRQGRSTYINGAAFCRKCGGFRGSMFRPIIVLGHMRKPLSNWERDWLDDLENDHEMNAHMDRKYPADAPGRRQSARVLRIRLNLFGAAPATGEAAA